MEETFLGIQPFATVYNSTKAKPSLMISGDDPASAGAVASIAPCYKTVATGCLVASYRNNKGDRSESASLDISHHVCRSVEFNSENSHIEVITIYGSSIDKARGRIELPATEEGDEIDNDQDELA